MEINQLIKDNKSKIRQTIISSLVVIIFIAALSLFVPTFFTLNNLKNILLQTSALGIMVIGITPILITGGMDISLPSIMAAASVIGASYMVTSKNPLLGCLLTLAVGGLIGLFNGFAVSILKMIPFVVTLSTMVVSTGLAVLYTNAQTVGGFPDGFVKIVNGEIYNIPVPVIILALITIIASLILRKTVYGRWIYSIGINAKAARVSNIPVDRVILLLYFTSGLLAGVAGIILMARLGAASPGMGPNDMVLDIMSAAVIGGVSIYGGKGSIIGALIGAFFITLIGNTMNLLHVTYFTTLMIKGLIIILATGLDTIRTRIGERPVK